VAEIDRRKQGLPLVRDPVIECAAAHACSDRLLPMNDEVLSL
jgi:hypothetical protein